MSSVSRQQFTYPWNKLKWSLHYSALKTEQRITQIRKQAIWDGKDPDVAERRYRNAIANAHKNT